MGKEDGLIPNPSPVSDKGAAAAGEASFLLGQQSGCDALAV